jgi:hypothetical protein
LEQEGFSNEGDEEEGVKSEETAAGMGEGTTSKTSPGWMVTSFVSSQHSLSGPGQKELFLTRILLE